MIRTAWFALIGLACICTLAVLKASIGTRPPKQTTVALDNRADVVEDKMVRSAPSDQAAKNPAPENTARADGQMIADDPALPKADRLPLLPIKRPSDSTTAQVSPAPPTAEAAALPAQATTSPSPAKATDRSVRKAHAEMTARRNAQRHKASHKKRRS
jgi:hypothetical protein